MNKYRTPLVVLLACLVGIFWLDIRKTEEASLSLTDRPIPYGREYAQSLRTITNLFVVENAGTNSLTNTSAHTANTFQLSVQGGDFLTPTQLTWNTGDDTFAFRNGSASEISHLYITAFSSTNNVNDGIRVENITVIPEPSSLLLLASALGACALIFRRRR